MNGHLIKKVYLESLKTVSPTLERDLEIARILLKTMNTKK
jgi:hypothetical protein